MGKVYPIHVAECVCINKNSDLGQRGHFEYSEQSVLGSKSVQKEPSPRFWIFFRVEFFHGHRWAESCCLVCLHVEKHRFDNGRFDGRNVANKLILKPNRLLLSFYSELIMEWNWSAWFNNVVFHFEKTILLNFFVWNQTQAVNKFKQPFYQKIKQYNHQTVSFIEMLYSLF
jgi:hypothetical protein